MVTMLNTARATTNMIWVLLYAAHNHCQTKIITRYKVAKLSNNQNVFGRAF